MNLENFLSIIKIMAVGGIWATAIVVSFFGLTTLIKPLKDEQIWIRCVIGCALFTSITGWLDYLHLGTSNNLFIIWALGILLLLPKVRTLLKEFKKETIRISATEVGIFFLVISFVMLGSYGVQWDANWDDSCGYVPPCHELMTNGSSWAPLSLRRACALGGEFPLQSLGMLWGGDKHWALYECSVPLLILGIILIHLYRKNYLFGKKGLILCSLILIVPQFNSSSAPNLLVMISCLALCLCKRTIFNISILIAFTLSLRLQSLPFLGVIAFWRIFDDNHQISLKTLQTRFLECVIIATAIIIYLVPFLLNNYAQFETPCILIGNGTINPEYLHGSYGIQSLPIGLFKLIQHGTSIFLLLCLIALSKTGRWVGIAAIVCYISLMASMTKFDAAEWLRYEWPFLSCAVLFFIINKLIKNRSRSVTTITLCIITCLVCINTPISTFTKKINAMLHDPLFLDTKIAEKSFVQEAVEPNKTLAIIADEVYSFDFKRNKILNLDYFPSIGNFPTETNPEKARAAWISWAKKHKTDYLIHIDFNEKLGTKTRRDIYTESNTAPILEDFYKDVWYPEKKSMIRSLESAEKIMKKETVGNYIILKF